MMSPPGPLFRAWGRRSAPQHLSHGRRLCGHCLPPVEDEEEQDRQGKGHQCRHQGVAAARIALTCADQRPRCRVGHGPSPDRSVVVGSGGRLTSGDECYTRRLTSNLGVRASPGVMPSYRLPGLPEDEPLPAMYSPGWRRRARSQGLPRRDARLTPLCPSFPPAERAVPPAPAPGSP